MRYIPFSRPHVPSSALAYIQSVLVSTRLSGDFEYTKKCHGWLEETINTPKALLTTSCTHALEMAALLSDIENGDEVIMPSFTFSSTATAFLMRGASLKFVDIRPDTMNIDENLIEAAITKKTKALVVVHYAGVACEMDTIMEIAKRHGLVVIEDAAQALMAKYKGRPLGSDGQFGCLSFHETKNYTSGEGGALLVNDPKYALRAEIIREKGTNRAQFFRGDVDKYTWLDIGSSYLPSDLLAALLYSQLEIAKNINDDRLSSWSFYYRNLLCLEQSGVLELPRIPKDCEHNAHMFYIKLKDLRERSEVIEFLKEKNIRTHFHYVPLHSSPAGMRFGQFVGQDNFTSLESERLLRLPLYYGMAEEDLSCVVDSIFSFFSTKQSSVYKQLDVEV